MVLFKRPRVWDLFKQLRRSVSRISHSWIDHPGASRFTQRIDEMATKKNTGKTTKPPAAKSPVPSPGKAPAAAAAPARAASAPVSSTPVRNTPIPKPVAFAAPTPAPARKEITQEMIALRAFEISQSALCGSEEDNWFKAERELRGV
jgi:hypothetical protein